MGESFWRGKSHGLILCLPFCPVILLRDESIFQYHPSRDAPVFGATCSPEGRMTSYFSKTFPALRDKSLFHRGQAQEDAKPACR